MRVLWTLMKIVLGLALVIPVAIIALAVALGLFGALLGLAIMTLRLAVVALVVVGAWKLGKALFGSSRPRVPEVKPLPPVDPYYEAAKRELDRELGHSRI